MVCAEGLWARFHTSAAAFSAATNKPPQPDNSSIFLRSLNRVCVVEALSGFTNLYRVLSDEHRQSPTAVCLHERPPTGRRNRPPSPLCCTRGEPRLLRRSFPAPRREPRPPAALDKDLALPNICCTSSWPCRMWTDQMHF